MLSKLIHSTRASDPNYLWVDIIRCDVQHTLRALQVEEVPQTRPESVDRRLDNCRAELTAIFDAIDRARAWGETQSIEGLIREIRQHPLIPGTHVVNGYLDLYRNGSARKIDRDLIFRAVEGQNQSTAEMPHAQPFSPDESAQDTVLAPHVADEGRPSDADWEQRQGWLFESSSASAPQPPAMPGSSPTDETHQAELTKVRDLRWQLQQELIEAAKADDASTVARLLKAIDNIGRNGETSDLHEVAVAAAKNGNLPILKAALCHPIWTDPLSDLTMSYWTFYDVVPNACALKQPAIIDLLIAIDPETMNRLTESHPKAGILEALQNPKPSILDEIPGLETFDKPDAATPGTSAEKIRQPVKATSSPSTSYEAQRQSEASSSTPNAQETKKNKVTFFNRVKNLSLSLPKKN